jgi:hypothetical protein
MRGLSKRFCWGEKVICVLVRALIGANLEGQNGKARTKQ